MLFMMLQVEGVMQRLLMMKKQLNADTSATSVEVLTVLIEQLQKTVLENNPELCRELLIDLQLKLTQVLRGKLTHLSGGVVSK